MGHIGVTTEMKSIKTIRVVLLAAISCIGMVATMSDGRISNNRVSYARTPILAFGGTVSLRDAAFLSTSRQGISGPSAHHLTSSMRLTRRTGIPRWYRGRKLDEHWDNAGQFAMASTAATIEKSTDAASVDHKSNTALCSEELQFYEEKEYRSLYPPLSPSKFGTLDVDSIHTLYYQEYGRPSNNSDSFTPEQTNTDAVSRQFPSSMYFANNVGRSAGAVKTSLFLHGGPGAGCFPNHARFFNPSHRIILFDQRGCGRSTPRGEIQNNTLSHLVQDCEALRIHLGIEKWDVILGGSWGSTLALAYAQEFPNRVGSLVLRGVCLLRTGEVNWLFGSSFSNGDAESGLSMSALNPEGWKEFENAVGIETSFNIKAAKEQITYQSSENRRQALNTYYDWLLGDDALASLYASQSWFRWEMGAGASRLKKSTNSALQAQASKLRICSETPKGVQPALLVWESNLGWSYRYVNGSQVANERELDGINQECLASVATGLRRWSNSNSSCSQNDTVDDSSPLVARPIQPIDKSGGFFTNNFTISEDEAKRYIPAQAMLTCYYSANNRFIMKDFDLLSKDRIDRIRHIPCIAIQGGEDVVCPPDTALDLHEMWPEMELRIVLTAGHSMYDPAIASEIVKATDFLTSDV